MAGRYGLTGWDLSVDIQLDFRRSCGHEHLLDAYYGTESNCKSFSV